MNPTLRDYFWAAFNARPIGMFVPPNWVGLAAFGLAGLLNPGFWVLGAGVELGYLYTLMTSARFQNVVKARHLLEQRKQGAIQQDWLVRQLSAEDRERFHMLEARCQTILSQQRLTNAGTELQAQGEGLGRLLWIYLRLMLTRRSLEHVLTEAGVRDSDYGSLKARIDELNKRVQSPNVAEDLRKSLAGQIDILQLRMQKQEEAREKLAFLDAELTRIQEQVELIREQAVVTADPETVSQRIDQIAATLGGTTQWIQEQQQLFGKIEDLLVEPPAVVMPEQQLQ
jgi:hypothetical protein